jgi:transcriptional regulator with XRE-family HTH domain
MTKGILAQEFWDSISKQRQDAIKVRAERRIEEYRNLQELRKSAGLTQEKLSEALHMSQGNLSRLERSSDMLLSTLQEYVKAIGGTLKLSVELPNQPPIPLEGFGDLIEQESPHPE